MSFDIDAAFDDIVSKQRGWCSRSKMNALFGAVRDMHAHLTVEIGVFGGASLIPQALAHRYHTGGRAFGIDPWNAEDALQSSQIVPNGFDGINVDTRAYDWPGLYQSVLDAIERHDVGAHCLVLRARAYDIAESFSDRSVDLLHIDGNHGDEAVMRDVTLWLPKVREGGLIWFDDAYWPSVQPAVDMARRYCTVEPITVDNNVVLRRVS